MTSPVLGFGITLDDVKTYLGYSLTDTTHDFRIIMTFNAAIATLGSITGRNLVYGSYRDTFNPMFRKVYLTETPVAFLFSIHQEGAAVLPASSYKFYVKTGLVEFKYGMPSNPMYLDSCGDTMVDYVGGYVFLPADLQQALFTALQAADVFQKQVAATGTVVKRLTVYDVGVTEYATSSSTSSVLSDTLSNILLPNLVDGGYTMGTPNTHESELMGPAGFWDPSEASPIGSPVTSPLGVTQPLEFIGPTAPIVPLGTAYVWYQTGLGGGTDITVWVEDGL